MPMWTSFSEPIPSGFLDRPGRAEANALHYATGDDGRGDDGEGHLKTREAPPLSGQPQGTKYNHARFRLKHKK